MLMVGFGPCPDLIFVISQACVCISTLISVPLGLPSIMSLFWSMCSNLILVALTIGAYF